MGHERPVGPPLALVGELDPANEEEPPNVEFASLPQRLHLENGTEGSKVSAGDPAPWSSRTSYGSLHRCI